MTYFIASGESQQRKKRIGMAVVYRAFTVSVDWIVILASIVSTNSGLKIFEKNSACSRYTHFFLNHSLDNTVASA